MLGLRPARRPGLEKLFFSHSGKRRQIARELGKLWMLGWLRRRILRLKGYELDHWNLTVGLGDILPVPGHSRDDLLPRAVSLDAV